MYRCNAITIDAERFELRCGGVVRHVEPQVFSLIQYLIENRQRVVSKDELVEAVWHGRIVSDSTLSSRITAARRALDDDGEQQAVIQTVPRRGFRFVADVDTDGVADAEPVMTETGGQADGAELPAQEVRFCTGPDGVSLAYSVAGEGYPIVKTANWLSHVEHDWHSPVWRHLLSELAASHRLVRYDQRGMGLSEWDVPAFGIEGFVNDLETVVDELGLDRFVLFGLSQGCAISLAYAARHAERIRGLILYGGYSRGWKRRGMTDDAEQEERLLALAEQGWGRDNPAFRQVFTSLYAPDATPEQMDWYNELQRISTSGENVVRIDQALGEIDVSDLLPDITVPAVVLHCRDDSVVPFSEGRRLASLLPNARFVALEGRNHLLLESEPAWPRFRSEIGSFLRDLGV